MNRRQKIVKGSCTNCGLSDHDAKHCLERPRKVPARFLHNNQVQEPNVREVAAPKDEWDKYLLKKQEEKELRRSTGGGVRSFRCREDIPEYLRKPVKLDKDKDKYKAFGDLTAHYDPRVRFNYRKKISAGKENFELGVPLCMTSWMDTEIGVGQDPAGSSVSQAETKEMTASSIHVGIVDYARTPEEVQQHFQSRGTVNRVTILTDKFGQPEDAVQNAPV